MQGESRPINVFRPRRNSGHGERIPGLVHPLPGPTFNQRRIDRYPAQVKPIPYRNLLKSQTDIEHALHAADVRGIPARKVEGDEHGTAGERGRHACGRRNIKTRKIHGLDERKIAKQTSRIFRGLNAIFNPNGFYISIIFRSAPGRITRNIRQPPHFSAIFRANRQAAFGINHPFAAAPSLPAVGLSGGAIRPIGFPVGHGSRFCSVNGNAGIRSVIFSSILRRSTNTSATCRSISVAGNVAGLHAVGLRARDVTSRTGHSAIGGSTRAIDRSSSGAPFFVCCRPPSCAIAGATGHSPTASTNAIAPLNARTTRWSTFFIASPITQ